MKLHYVQGDATKPIGAGRKVIAHCCNDIGQWGAGFVTALSRMSKIPELNYRIWATQGYLEGVPFKQGQMLLVNLPGSDLAVAHIIGQSGCGNLYGFPPVRYGALEEGFIRLKERMSTTDKWSLHMPKIGCGLAGGKWEIIEDIINRVFDDVNIQVYVYEYM